MSGYQRFLPRDGTRTTARAVAEVAEAAEDKAPQGSPTAETLLKPAEVCLREHQLQQASAEVQRQETSRIPELQQPQQLQQAPSSKNAKTRDGTAGLHPQASPSGAARAAIPAEWCEGVLRLAAMRAPRKYPEHAWTQLIADAERFLDDWAAQAHRLGWQDWELFGCHRRAPWGRIQAMGLVLLLRGDEIAALTVTEAVIRTRSGCPPDLSAQAHGPAPSGAALSGLGAGAMADATDRPDAWTPALVAERLAEAADVLARLPERARAWVL